MKVRSMKGRTVDFGSMAEDQNRVALGNAKMNARGDIIGRGGIVVMTKEEVIKEYYNKNPRAATTSPVSLNSITDEVLTPEEAISQHEKKVAEINKKVSKRKIVEGDD